MICAKCNAKNPDENLKCSNCGAPLQSDDAIDSFSGMKTSLNIENASGSFKKGDIFAGRYEILEDGLKGGMGMVYKVKDNTLGKISALKIILPAFLENVKAVSRFKQEVAISLDLNHENIVRVYDIGESEGIIYFTMEWVDGISLRDYINERKKHDNKPSYEELLNLAKQLCSALSEAHKTITHRDIKPENIMVLDRYSQKPRIKITDFGIAKTESQALHVSVSTYMGTPIYMAPEQYTDASHADKRADIFSIGVVLYEFMTFLQPQGIFPMPSEINPLIPKKVDEIIRKALSADRTMRYGDAMDIVKAIEAPPVETVAIQEKPIQEKSKSDFGEIKEEQPSYKSLPLSGKPTNNKSKMILPVIGVILIIVASFAYMLSSKKDSGTAVNQAPVDVPVSTKVNSSVNMPETTIPPEGKGQIAVSFINRSSHGGSNYSQKAADLMIKDLANSGFPVIMEKNRVDNVIREQNVHASGKIDPQTAKKIGQMLGADIILLGTINTLEVRKNIQKIGDSTITQYNAIAELNLKAVNMKTGEILFSDSDEESVTEKGASVPGYEMAVSPPSLDRPLKIAVQRLSDKFIGTMKTN